MSRVPFTFNINNMATKQVVQQKAKQAPSPQPRQNAQAIPLLFDRDKYVVMVVGVVVILLGFALMSGGNNNNPAVFPKEELYSFRRVTLAPIMVVLGFAIEI